jgi:hypothetical protein
MGRFSHFLHIHGYQFLGSRINETNRVGGKLLPLEQDICLEIEMRMVNKAVVVFVYHDSDRSLVLDILRSYVGVVSDFVCEHANGHFLGYGKV